MNLLLEIEGEQFPCTPTMGAMLRFKQETGREVNEIDPNSFTDLCTYLWCCVVSGCAREKKPFGLPLMDFADRVTPEDMEGWTSAVLSAAPEAGYTDADDEKKSPRAYSDS